MAENIRSTSEVKLYGRTFDGFQATEKKQFGKTGARFARIHCFSYEGALFSLPKPAIILVHGEGDPAADFDVVTDLTPPAGFNVWSYDKEDMSVVCQIYSGTLNDLLLGHVMPSGDSGLNASGQMNSSGQMNASGQMNISCRGGRF